MANPAFPRIDRELRAFLEHLVSRDKRLPDGESKRQVVLATLRRFKDAGQTGATLADIVGEEAEKMAKRLAGR
ncbi:MAG: hypothetical protein U0R44_01095 [Candidatus Micrarchaeia archaeon]